MSGVHRTAHVGPGVELGRDVTVGPFAVLIGPCEVGDGAWIGSHAAIGGPAEMRGGPHPTADEVGDHGVRIGPRSVIREFVTVNQGSHRRTEIGADAYLMAGAHVPHDAVLGDGVTMACTAVLGGHVWIGDGANLGLGVVLHQRGVIGAHAMVGMQASVTKPIPPFAVAVGVPARVTGANEVGLSRLGVDPALAAAWGRRLAAGEIVGEDGPADLAGHVEAWRTARDER